MPENKPADYMDALSNVDSLLEEQARLEATMQEHGAELGRIRRECLPAQDELQQRKSLGRVMMELGGVRRQLKQMTTVLNDELKIENNT